MTEIERRNRLVGQEPAKQTYGEGFIAFGGCDVYKQRLADEIADVIQAACNLADRHGIDLQEAMERCEERNRKRGRYEGEQAVR